MGAAKMGSRPDGRAKKEGLSNPLQRVDRDLEGIVSIRVDDLDLVGSDDGDGRIPSAVFDHGQRPAVTADHPGTGGVLPDPEPALVREDEFTREDPVLLFGDAHGDDVAGEVGESHAIS